jgi:putative transposase
MIKAYKYRICPTEEQRNKINQTIGACRFVYNWGLHKFQEECDKYDSLNWYYPYQGFIDTYDSKKFKKIKEKGYNWFKPKLDQYKISKELTILSKREHMKWLREVENMPLRQTLEDLKKAYTNFLNGSGYLKYKKKRDKKQSYRTYESTHVKKYADFENHIIDIPKVGKVKAILHRYFKGKVCYITVSKDNINRYYVSITVDNNVQNKEQVDIKNINIDNSVGIDLGLKDSVVLSNGVKYNNPKFLNRCEKRKAKLQKKLARRAGNEKGSIKSHRYNILNNKINKLSKHIMEQRNYFLHDISSKIINENQVNMIGIEDLNVKGMVANRKLSKSISDVSWSKFVEMLKYKANFKGIRIIEIDRFAPSSQLCNCCGYQNKELMLSDREWKCPKCGEVHDRDINAAINIKNIALKQLKLSENSNIGDKKIGRFTTKSIDNNIVDERTGRERAKKGTRRTVKGRNLPELSVEDNIQTTPNC